jgi:sugar phosphate permease
VTAAFPAAFLAQKLPLGKFLASLVVTWGVVTMLTATVSSYPGLLVQRFFLGFCEAGAGPGFSLMIPLFWKRHEQPLRYSLWYMSQGLGGFLGPMMVYGIGHIHGDLSPWKYQYLILGAITVAWGVIMVFALPNNPESAWFLDEAERKVAAARIRLEQVTEENKTIKLHQIVEALKDPKTWLTVISTYCIHFINGVCSGFGSIIVKSFGYSPFKSVLLTGCAGLYLLGVLAITGAAANHLRNARTVVWCICEVFVIAGAALIWQVQWSPDHSAALGGFFLLFTFPPSYTMLLSLVGSNTGGYTKKVFVMALVWMAYCVSNGTAPLFIKTTEVQEHYPTLFRVALTTASLSVACSLVMRFYLINANKKRDQNLDAAIREGTIAQDLTDWENPHFRYTL